MTPALNWNKVVTLTSFEDPVLRIFNICGTNPKVVRNAAVIPIKYQYIFLLSLCYFQFISIPTVIASGIKITFKKEHYDETKENKKLSREGFDLKIWIHDLPLANYFIQ